MTPEGYAERKDVECLAIWDTGATNSVISIQLAKQLNLIPSDIITVVGVHGSKDCPSYFIDVILNGQIRISSISVTEGNLGDDIGFLIGMDIIARGDFSLTTKLEGEQLNSCFSFQFPSNQKPINYVERLESIILTKQKKQDNIISRQNYNKSKKNKRKH